VTTSHLNGDGMPGCLCHRQRSRTKSVAIGSDRHDRNHVLGWLRAGADRSGLSSSRRRKPAHTILSGRMTRQSVTEELESAADPIAEMWRADLQIILRRAALICRRAAGAGYPAIGK
jgi:hypothetical protein